MEFLTFEALQTHLYTLLQEQEYEQVRQLAAEQITQYPEQFHILAYWQITAAARQKEYAACVQLIQGLLERCFWYGESLLTMSPSLAALQELPEFIAVVERSRDLRAQSEKESFPLLILRQQGRCQLGGPACPLMIALHTNGATLQDSLEFWKPAATEGWIVAAPQSSQALWKGAYVWDDRETARRDIQRQHVNLVRQYAIDPERIILAGHGLGGETAMWLVLNAEIPAKGFIAFGPSGPLIQDPDQWHDLLLGMGKLGLRGYIVMGEEDESIHQENIHLLVDLLNEAGIPCDLEIVPLVGHDYDPVYDDCMLRALEYIFPTSTES